MKHLTRFLLLSAAGFVWTAVGSAATIDLVSNQNNVTYTNGPVKYSGSQSTNNPAFSGGPYQTYNITPDGVWSNPVSTPDATASNWVSFDPGTDVNGAHGSGVPNPNAPNGTYTYQSQNFNLTPGTYQIDIQVLADDTTSVWINGTDEVIDPGSGQAEHCVDAPGPTCTMTYTDVFDYTFTGSTNFFVFDVSQLYGNATGLDYAIAITPAPAPEPSSLMLLGTGLLGAAGMIRRRIRA